MTVQTFLIEETKELIHDESALKEWQELIEEMGVKGQAKLSYDDSKSPIPFMSMNTVLKNTVKTLCETERNYKEYNKEPIPLEVLRLLKLAENEKYFQKIVIHYDEKDPDPIAVGIVGNYSTYSSNKEWSDKRWSSEEEARADGLPENESLWFSEKDRYLIARWGAESVSIPDLIKIAKDKWFKKETIEQNKIIREAQRAIEDIESNAFNMFGV